MSDFGTQIGDFEFHGFGRGLGQDFGLGVLKDFEGILDLGLLCEQDVEYWILEELVKLGGFPKGLGFGVQG